MKKQENAILDEELGLNVLNSGNNRNSANSLYTTFQAVLNKVQQSEKENAEIDLKLLMVEKQLQISQIEEIDNKIANLQLSRKQALKTIASLEKEEIKIKTVKESLKARKDRISNLEMIAEEKSNPNEGSMKFVSKPLPKNAKKPLVNSAHKGRLTRNITPVLQNYYKPLSLINQYQLPNLNLRCIDFDIPFGSMFFLSKEMPHSIGMCEISSNLETHKSSKGDELSSQSENSNTSADSIAQIKKEDIKYYSGSQATINCFKYHDNTLFAGSNDAKVYIFNKFNGEEITSECCSPALVLDSHTKEVTCLDYEGEILVSGSQDRTVRQWDLNKECCVNVIDLNMIVQGSLLNPTRMFSGTMTPGASSWMSTSTGFRSRSDSMISRSGSVFDFNAIMNGPSSNGGLDVEPIYSPYITSGYAFNKSGDEELAGIQNPCYNQVPYYISKIQVFDAALATGTSDGTVRLWDIRSKNVMRQLSSTLSAENGFSAICDMKFDNHQIVASNYNGEVIIWDLRMGKILNLLKVGNELSVGSKIHFEMNRNHIVANNNFDGTVHLYDRTKQNFVKWDQKNEDSFTNNVNSIRLKSAYFLEGYDQGIVKSWRI
ncbi:hypothetical protein ACO0R3_002024 [Hanseniaspora guilliermondii]